jgi:hypothetical protein
LNGSKTFTKKEMYSSKEAVLNFNMQFKEMNFSQSIFDYL